MLTEILTLLEKDKIEDAYALSEQLRQSGTPITSIRARIYDDFQFYKRTNPRKAEKIKKVFGKDYQFQYWLCTKVT